MTWPLHFLYPSYGPVAIVYLVTLVHCSTGKDGKVMCLGPVKKMMLTPYSLFIPNIWSIGLKVTLIMCGYVMCHVTVCRGVAMHDTSQTQSV